LGIVHSFRFNFCNDLLVNRLVGRLRRHWAACDRECCDPTAANE